MMDMVQKIKIRNAGRKLKGRWWWAIIAYNNKILATSEMYASKRGCLKTAKQIASQLGVEVEQ